MQICPKCGSNLLQVDLISQYIWDQGSGVLELAGEYADQPTVSDIDDETAVLCDECQWFGLIRDLDEVDATD